MELTNNLRVTSEITHSDIELWNYSPGNSDYFEIKGLLSLLGYSLNEINIQLFEANVKKETVADINGYNKKIVSQEIKGYTLKYLVKNKFNQWRTIYTTTKVIQYNDKDVGIQLASHHHDYTDEVKLNSVLKSRRRLHNLFRSVFDEIPLGMFIMDYNCKIVKVNPGMCLLLQTKPKLIINSCFNSLLNEDYCVSFNEDINKLKEGDSNHIKIEIQLKNSVYIHLGITSVRSNENVIEYFIGLIERISERKITEQRMLSAVIEKEDSDRKKTAELLHEDLAPILSTAKFYIKALDTISNEKQKQRAIISAENTIDQAITVIKDISTELSPHVLHNFGINSAVQKQILKLFDNTNIHVDFCSNLEKRFDRKTEINVFGIINELFHNTLKHAKANRIVLNISTIQKEVRITYTDNGIGFCFDKEKMSMKGTGIPQMISRVK
ncbi:MAG: PAS domain S-box protein, partial [Bacteroidales bacterium]|nr:PAS domain S-box protein [Bacteroidales bacterium]